MGELVVAAEVLYENKAFAIEWACLRLSYLNMYYEEETYEQAIGVSKISV